MAKIIFNNKNYNIDESALATSATELQSHLSTEMNGEGAKIIFGGTEYGIDSAKLSAEVNNFVAYLQTIAGEGLRVVVGGVEYSVDPNKVANAIANLETVLSGLNGGADRPNGPIAAGLYQTGSNYTVMLKSWQELLDEEIICVEPELSVDDGHGGTLFTAAGVAYMPESEENILALAGDLVFPNDGSISNVGLVDDYEWYSYHAFAYCSGLTSVTISDGVINIDACAFDTCSNLTSITIPQSVERIGSYAFNDCINLTDIIFKGTVEQWEDMLRYEGWNRNVPAAYAQCSDGQATIEPYEEPEGE